MKAGDYIRFAGCRENGMLFTKTGESSSEDWAKRDGAADVSKPGGADVVYVVKVIAVVRRSAQIEE